MISRKNAWALCFAALPVGVCFMLLLTGCGGNHLTEAEPSLYFWKSGNSNLSTKETRYITDLQVKNLYVKFFEVAPDRVFVNSPVSKTELYLPDYNQDYYKKEDSAIARHMLALNIIPVVYVQNAVLKNISAAGIDSLADNLVFLVRKYSKRKFDRDSTRLNEIQIDCDWTPSTKENFFSLLRSIRKHHPKKLSCTLRLYPYKYRDNMGIPPVDRVTLMCYNLTSPLESPGTNSIQDVKEFAKYLKNTSKYPIQTDIALPLFSWMQVYQNGEFKGLISSGPDLNPRLFKLSRPHWYTVLKDTVIGRYYLREGDAVKHEASRKEDTGKMIALLKKHVEFSPRTRITFFHLDESGFANYTNEEILSLYSAFSH